MRENPQTLSKNRTYDLMLEASGLHSPENSMYWYLYGLYDRCLSCGDIFRLEAYNSTTGQFERLPPHEEEYFKDAECFLNVTQTET